MSQYTQLKELSIIEIYLYFTTRNTEYLDNINTVEIVNFIQSYFFTFCRYSNFIYEKQIKQITNEKKALKSYIIHIEKEWNDKNDKIGFFRVLFNVDIELITNYIYEYENRQLTKPAKFLA